MAKATTIKVKLVSSADTGFYYVTKKNSRTMTEKLSKKKYDPVAKKHVEFREVEDQVSGAASLAGGVPAGALCVAKSQCLAVEKVERPAKRWPAGSGVMRRPLAPLPSRPNPTDPGDAADLSIP